MAETYTLHVAGLTRELTICKVNDHMDIAAFIMLGDAELTVVVEDQSITTAGKQKLVIDRKELEKMNGKRVLVVDDVISTGGSLKALDALAEKTQCTIVGQAAVLAEGDASERKDIIFLEPLPLFFH